MGESEDLKNLIMQELSVFVESAAEVLSPERLAVVVISSKMSDEQLSAKIDSFMAARSLILFSPLLPL